uniref:TYR_PHOSPHATASE_2 domain-containing protein n=1 Tax=Macrostomum lignano TaxID=282301 RepID=A0A1I8HPI8_9PLAT
MASKFLPAPSSITYRDRSFLIMDRPSDANVDKFVAECRNHGVSDVVRVCESSYSTEPLEKAAIQRWAVRPDACIAIHCIAGLGRAPVMVAIALMELGSTYDEAVQLIRAKRRGAINKKQLDYLSLYRAKGKLKPRRGIMMKIAGR